MQLRCIFGAMKKRFRSLPLLKVSYAVSFAAVSWLSQSVAYKYLTFLHSYVYVVLLGWLTGGGLLYLKLEPFVNPNRGRLARKVVWTTWLGPIPALVYFGVSIFLVFACLAPVRNFASVLTGRNCIATLVGLSSILWRVLLAARATGVQGMGRWKLQVIRTPYLELNENDDYVRKSERIQVRRVFADN